MKEVKNFQVYIHIPFCKQKCFYCDFPSWAGKEKLMAPYIAALCEEIKAKKNLYDDCEVTSVYIGGGTPTTLPISLIADLFQVMRENFHLTSETEITFEANPNTLNLEMATALYTLGVNRLSIGAQSFDNKILKRIGRIHTVKDIRDSVRFARAAGIVNVNLDLMYGLPNQTLEIFQESINQSMDLAVTHLSIYGLQLEEGTPFFDDKNLNLPSDEVCEAMYDYAVNQLPKFGFERYEISNYARSHFACRHNLGYWHDENYLGFGAAAHSYWQGRRGENPRDLENYLKNFSTKWEADDEKILKRKRIEEFCFLALRTTDGISRKKFFDTFQIDLENLYADALRELQEKNWLVFENDFYHLTQAGMKLGNLAFEKFLLGEGE